MTKIQTKIKFGRENLESLIDEIVKDKIYEVTNRLKNGEFEFYNQKENYPSTNTDKKVDETK
ncbi:hypothetical protein [Hathewaya massiliensis]|uniref:hypothetical protein n=1 Tax=Hathewaya massiliensis TaxID=1964382 RepID=UPI001157B289|nr:hypothetical protein [Hathewaya massiliensis]